jgi:RNA polymerase sigma factor (sigma-70 family)
MVSNPVLGSHWGSERELVCAAARGEAGALECLVEAYTPHIAKAARVYRNNASVDRAELIQDGVVGLLRALERFDPSLGTPFWAYASWWVKQSMQQLVAEMTRQVVLSDRALRRLSRIKDNRSAWLRTRGREPTVRELMHACGCTRDQVEQLLAAELPSRGLDEPCTMSDGSGETLGERLPDETSVDAYDAVVNRTQLDGLRERCAELPERERHVVYRHFGLGGQASTLRDIAMELSLSVERVRQIEDGALRKLRAGFDVPADSEDLPWLPHAPMLRVVDPGDSPSALREVLTRELAAEHCRESIAHDLVCATHEVTAGAWRARRPPRQVSLGSARGSTVCEISDPAAGPLSRAAAALVTRLTSRIERIGPRPGGTFRLWALRVE